MDNLINLAKKLKLPTIANNICEDINQANLENLSYEEFLIAIFEKELLIRKNNGIRKRIRQAKSLMKKDLKNWMLMHFQKKQRNTWNILKI